MNGDIHPEMRVGRTDIGAVKRDGLTRITRYRDANEIAVADNAVGRIELDPARALGGPSPPPPEEWNVGCP